MPSKTTRFRKLLLLWIFFFTSIKALLAETPQSLITTITTSQAEPFRLPQIGEPNYSLQDTLISHAVADTAESPSVKTFLNQGHFEGHVRNYFMATFNHDELPDYHALAIGTGLSYVSAKLHGFQFGVGGLAIIDLWSNNLGRDPETNLGSRYEIGNFDQLDPDNKGEIGSLEILFARYYYKKATATLGRQKIITPFINPQDGRMRPTLVNAFWLESKDFKNLTLQGGWIYGMGPRSTADWFSVEESIGPAPVGRNTDGTPAQYKGNLSSKGIAVGGLTYQPQPSVTASLWHYYADNLFNLTSGQADFVLPTGPNRKSKIILGLQATYQQASGNGGNPDPQKSYIDTDSKNWILSSRVGYKSGKVQTTLNATQMLGDGRFLFPREWGIEPFYTFMPRERLEGSAGSKAIALLTDIQLNKSWKARIGYGLTNMPDVKDVARNKYGMPSYSQLQLMSIYTFKGTLEGMNLQALYIYKGNRGNTYNTPGFEVNKVDMSHISLIMNYHFN
ncbi:OprD family outer membrane porin [Pontibacter sp. MBLB2868]|uniref:OprD family outer membrane porin n=1 Tax=Pontibacter sp. MBLB2868 TaxID=3451555 RepID=UPI003F753D24